MVDFFPGSSSAAHNAVRRLVEALAKDGVEVPPRIFMDVEGADWRREAAEFPAACRRRSILATASEKSLFDAVRMEIGGAVRFPVSTEALREACASAALAGSDRSVSLTGRGVLEVVLGSAVDLSVVGWFPVAFWTCQAGAPRMTRSLLAVARRLGCLSAVLPGPLLVVAGCHRRDVEAACDAEGEAVMPVAPAVEVVTADRDTGMCGRVDAIIAAVAELATAPDRVTPAGGDVFELPSGRSVGRWATTDSGPAGSGGWRAHPEPASGAGMWRVDTGESVEVLLEIDGPDDLGDEGQPVVRVPGWLGAELRFGSPATLAVGRLARHPSRGGRPLWVPGVDADGVRFLLGQPGPIWVDGPGVPKV